MDDFKLIDLGNGIYAKVDCADFGFLSQFSWRLTSNGYATTTVNYGKGEFYNVKMHRAVTLAIPTDVRVDHINQDKLDNRRSNLRFANASQNAANRGKNFEKFGDVEFKGVYQNKHAVTCSARIRVGKKTIYLASFYNRDEAARLYDAAARIAFGEFACLNFPEFQDQNVTSLAEKVLRKHGIEWVTPVKSEG